MLMDVTPEQIDAWGEELAELTDGLAHLFARPEPAEVFADLIEGLLDRSISEAADLLAALTPT